MRTLKPALAMVAIILCEVAGHASGAGDSPKPSSIPSGSVDATRSDGAQRDEPTSSVPSAADMLAGLREFYRKTARPDGSFQPGIDPEYRGMSDTAYSDLAAVTYAVTIHKTFGWELPNEGKTIEFLLSRQKENGSFFNVAGTVDPNSAEGRVYNTTQALVALHALGVTPRYDALGVFEDILREDYKTLPAFSTSFFPLAYLCAGKAIPPQADRGIRALMVQDETGYLNDHIAATFHASHYYRLVGEETPKSREMVARILRDQKADGSWLLNLPARDRHATFDAVFSLLHEGNGRQDCRDAVARAGHWALACRNDDGGFGHFPGSTSDADAVYFQVGTLVMAGIFKPVDPLPDDPHLLSWGHVMPVTKARGTTRLSPKLSIKLPGWVASVVFDPDGQRFATACSDGIARVYDSRTGREQVACRGHEDAIAGVCFSPDGKQLATASYDRTAAIWDVESGKRVHRLVGHRGAVLCAAFSPDGKSLATAGFDGTIHLWDPASGRLTAQLKGHKSWVSAIAFARDGSWLASGSSDGTIRIWSRASRAEIRTIDATSAEVRSLAISADDKHLAAGLRYGRVKLWNTADWRERLDFKAHDGDVWAIAFSPSGEHFASGNGDWNRGGAIKMWRTGDGTASETLQHTGEVLAIAYSPDGKTIVASAADKTVKTWRLVD